MTVYNGTRKIEDIYYSGPKKYWKEITTSTEVEKEVLGYACYRQDKYLTPNIYYVKPPLGEDTVIYAYGYGFEYAPDYDSVTPLIAQGETEPAHFISVTEDTLNITGISAGSVDSLVRKKDHDIYHMATVTETTTEIVEGTKEDHTYSEPDVKQILSIHKPTGNTEPNATVVGSPTITGQGVVSGFSTSNYLSLPETFAPVSGNVWEIGFKVTTGSNVTTQQTVLGCTPPNCGGMWLGLGRSSTAKFDFSAGSGTSSSSDWNIASHVAGSTTITTNTTYYIKIVFTGSEYKVLISTNNIDWITDISATSSVVPSAYTNRIGIVLSGVSSYVHPWLGSIDLSESYIKINGKYWWKGTKPEYDLLYNKNISLLKAEDFNSIKESSSGVAIWGG